MALDALLTAFESLWGIEEGALEPRVEGVAWVERPWGFRVAEPRSGLEGRGRWAVYLVRRVGLDSMRAAALLRSRLGARRYSIQGLKDACAVAYQYVALLDPREAPRYIALPRLQAWLVGLSTAPLRLGGHGFNLFLLEVRGEADWNAFCTETVRTRWIPGYYGPQRFGVERPNTHYLGLLAARGCAGRILREYKWRYPLEERREPGDYESRILRAAHRSASPLEGLEAGPQRLYIEALQAYIFNRALSKALQSRGPHRLREIAEGEVTLHCPRGPVRAPAASLLPLDRKQTLWASQVEEVLSEELLDAASLQRLIQKRRRPPRRPLLYPVCSAYCKAQHDGAILALALPRGAYATILLRNIIKINWIKYAHCRIQQ